MRTTGRFDSKKQEIFEGDRVIHCWGWFKWKGGTRHYYQIHTITIVPDEHGLMYKLGACYNRWEGNQVQKLSEQELKNINMPDDVYFFFEDNGAAVRYTDQHFFGMSDEQWEKEVERRKQGNFTGIET